MLFYSLKLTLLNFSPDLSEIIFDGRHEKVGESGWFRFLREILIMPQMGEIFCFWVQNQDF